MKHFIFSPSASLQSAKDTASSLYSRVFALETPKDRQSTAGGSKIEDSSSSGILYDSAVLSNQAASSSTKGPVHQDPLEQNSLSIAVAPPPQGDSSSIGSSPVLVESNSSNQGFTFGLPATTTDQLLHAGATVLQHGRQLAHQLQPLGQELQRRLQPLLSSVSHAAGTALLTASSSLQEHAIPLLPVDMHDIKTKSYAHVNRAMNQLQQMMPSAASEALSIRRAFCHQTLAVTYYCIDF